MLSANAKLQQAVKNLPTGTIVLFLVDYKDYDSTNLNLLKFMTSKKKAHGIYISVNKPYANLTNILKKNGVNTEKLFFIDCVTKSAGGAVQRTDNCLYISSPTNLTDLGIALDDAIESLGDHDKFIFLDSVSTLMVYHNPDAVLHFAHFLTTRARVKSFYGIFITVESEADAKLVKTLSQFCDKVIKLS